MWAERRRRPTAADDDANEPPGLGRVVRRAHLEHHLVLVAQVDPLGERAVGNAPEVESVGGLRGYWLLG
jgi:hypothetical protein